MGNSYRPNSNMNNKTNKKRKMITPDRVSRIFTIETVIFIGLMSIAALGLMYALGKLLLFLLGGVSVSQPFF